MIERAVDNEQAMESLGRALARCLREVSLVCLRGELGAGKTTLVRGVLRGLGYPGIVKSPTFTLVEPYEFGQLTLHHFDFYRLKEPEEAEFLGLRDALRSGNLCLVEWPERAQGVLPVPDIEVIIEKLDGERRVHLLAHGRAGEKVLECLR
jgi:tRNA threonylcarbamoyladenosine biosynthesis protein TsaE